MDSKKEKSNNASKATKTPKKKRKGKLKASWLQKWKKQRRPQIF